MSRISNAPVQLPKDVEATVSDASVAVKGSKGSLSLALHHLVNVEKILLMSNGQIVEEGNFSQLINQKGLFYAMSIENKFE